MAATDIIVTSDLYGGEAGLRSILNDYYENEIEELLPEEQPIAKRFIEEGLIVAGKRVGVTEGVEKEHYQVNELLLDKLLESRLIRVENTHLGKSFEVSHDAMVAPIGASYDKRRRIEEKAAKEAELKRSRRQFLVAAGIALVGFLLAAIAIWFYYKAEKALEELKVKQRDNVIERSKGFIATGQTYQERSDFELAIKEFESTKNVIETYNQLLEKPDTTIIQYWQKADSLIINSKISEEIKKKFDEAMEEGRNHREKTDTYKGYLAARRSFERAKKFDTKGIAKVAYDENENDLTKLYDSLVKDARTLFKAKDKTAYGDAFLKYQKAAVIQALDPKI